MASARRLRAIVGDRKRLATCLRRILLHSSMSDTATSHAWVPSSSVSARLLLRSCVGLSGLSVPAGEGLGALRFVVSCVYRGRGRAYTQNSRKPVRYPYRNTRGGTLYAPAVYTHYRSRKRTYPRVACLRACLLACGLVTTLMFGNFVPKMFSLAPNL